MTSLAFAAAALAATLRFSIPEGEIQNEFFRDGPVAAHLVLRPGTASRIVFAFPAGNSGAALWLDAATDPLAWDTSVTMEPVTRTWRGVTLRGVAATFGARGGPVSVREAILGNIRTIREYEYTGAKPPEIAVAPRVQGNTATWQRSRLDGKSAYVLEVEMLEGRIHGDGTPDLQFAPADQGRMRLRVTALTGDAPLTPLAKDALILPNAAPDARLRQILAYLSYEEKLLAGSWRFATYFGRDTLMSLRLLSPVLQPAAFEAGLGAVLERLNAAGEVAHEEDIGEFALLRRKQEGRPLSDEPILDYKMIDDDFMLAIVAAHYLLDTAQGRARAEPFLARKSAAGESYGSALLRNFRFVIARAAPFARDPEWRNLVPLKPGQNVGNWRDSEEGLGGGRYPYDVNGVLVPAALEGIARLEASGRVARYIDQESRTDLAQAGSMAAVWRRESPRLFDVDIAASAAWSSVEAYAKEVGVDPSRAVGTVGLKPVRFRAVSLDATGKPVPVMNSDEAFALLFLDLTAAEAARIAVTLTRNFPAGLMTDVGLLVANPAFAPRNTWPEFDRGHYHGSVVWSWHHALLRAGLDRQLTRNDLPDSTRAALAAARDRLLDAMQAANEMRGSELWSWSASGKGYEIEPFGQASGHVTESNAAQLWSAVHLAWR